MYSFEPIRCCLLGWADMRRREFITLLGGHDGDIALNNARSNAEGGADWSGHPDCKPESSRSAPARASGPWLRRGAKLRVGRSLRRGEQERLPETRCRTGRAR